MEIIIAESKSLGSSNGIVLKEASYGVQMSKKWLDHHFTQIGEKTKGEFTSDIRDLMKDLKSGKVEYDKAVTSIVNDNGAESVALTMLANF